MIARLRRRYRTLPTQALKVLARAYRKPYARFLFAADLVAIEMELLDRELPELARVEGGFLCVTTGGWH